MDPRDFAEKHLKKTPTIDELYEMLPTIVGYKIRIDRTKVMTEGKEEIIGKIPVYNTPVSGMLLPNDPRLINIPIVDDNNKPILSKVGFQMSRKYEKKFTQPALSLSGATLINKSEIMVLVALPGTGKSQTTEGMAAGFIAQRSGFKTDDFGFTFDTSDNRDLLVVDQERPLDINRDGYERICKRLNKPELINEETGLLPFLNYQCFIEEPSTQVRREMFENLVSTGKYSFAIIDGILGFTDTINDEKEANKTVLWLLSLASKYQFACIVTMHPNKGSEVMAGHLGGFLYRYSRACLLLKTHDYDKELKIITNQFVQQKTSYHGGELTIGMRYDKESGMFVSENNIPETKSSSTFDVAVIKTIFHFFKMTRGITKVSSSLFYGQLATETGISIETARKHCGNAIALGLIIKEGSGKATKYSINEEY